VFTAGAEKVRCASPATRKCWPATSQREFLFFVPYGCNVASARPKTSSLGRRTCSLRSPPPPPPPARVRMGRVYKRPGAPWADGGFRNRVFADGDGGSAGLKPQLPQTGCAGPQAGLPQTVLRWNANPSRRMKEWIVGQTFGSQQRQTKRKVTCQLFLLEIPETETQGQRYTCDRRPAVPPANAVRTTEIGAGCRVVSFSAATTDHQGTKALSRPQRPARQENS